MFPLNSQVIVSCKTPVDYQPILLKGELIEVNSLWLKVRTAGPNAEGEAHAIVPLDSVLQCMCYIDRPELDND